MSFTLRQIRINGNLSESKWYIYINNSLNVPAGNPWDLAGLDPMGGGIDLLSTQQVDP